MLVFASWMYVVLKCVLVMVRVCNSVPVTLYPVTLNTCTETPAFCYLLDEVCYV